MKSPHPIAIAFILMAAVACAQTKTEEKDSTLNRFSLSYRPAFNISAKFKNIGGFPARTKPGPATSGTDHIYDDGYNRVDDHSNNHGPAPFDNATWFWGYSSDSQYVGDTIAMHSSSAAPISSQKSEGDPQHGFELKYNRQLGRIGRCLWGLEAAFGYTDITISDGRTYNSPITQITDSYALGGVVPPPAPYSGTQFGTDGPGSGGPLLSGVPTRVVNGNAGIAPIVGQRSLEANFYGGRLGPYLEIPLGRRVSISFSGGLAVVGVDSTFGFTESVSIAGVGTDTRSSSGSHSGVLIGGYLSGDVSVALSPGTSLFVGAQFQGTGNYSHTQNGVIAELDLGRTVLMTVGVGFSF
jgi:hypothetical protein